MPRSCRLPRRHGAWWCRADGAGDDVKVLCGGEGLPRELARQLTDRSASVWNSYGPTETTIWSTLDRVQQSDQAVALGRPISNTQAYVLDANREPVPVGVPGELYSVEPDWPGDTGDCLN